MSAGHRRSKADIERELRDLGRALDTPAPDYSKRVLQALAAQGHEPAPATRPARGRILSPMARQILIAAAVILIAAAITPARCLISSRSATTALRYRACVSPRAPAAPRN
jgi:hypothetical protein